MNPRLIILFVISSVGVVSANNTAQPTASSGIFSFLNEAWYKVSHLATSHPKHVIDYKLQVPKAVDTDFIVKINSNDNNCIDTDIKSYYKRLFDKEKSTEKDSIKKTIFCPSAPTFLKSLDGLKLLASSTTDEHFLKDTLIALMLRKDTLTGKYLQSYMESQFQTCHNALWSKLQKDTTDTWPCNTDKCEPSEIKHNFSNLISDNESCKNVLKSELLEFSDEIVKTLSFIKTNKPLTIRKALRHNLSGSFSLALPFYSTIDTFRDGDHIAAAHHIESVLKDIKSALIRINPQSKIYSEAESEYKTVIAPKHTDSAQVKAHGTENVIVNRSYPESTTTNHLNEKDVKQQSDQSILPAINK